MACGVLDMLRKRVLTGVIGIIILFIVFLEGRFAVAGAVILLGFLGTKEYLAMHENEKEKDYSRSSTVYPVAILLVATTFVGIEVFGCNLLYGALFIAFLVLAFEALFRRPDRFLSRFKTELSAIFYVPFLLSHILLFKLPSFAELKPFGIIWFILITTWATDIGAYFIGTYLGKTKLAPRISPNKTIEGAAGGLLCGLLAAAIFARLIKLPMAIFLPLGFVLPLTGQIGDLYESGLKRNLACKDSGTFFPGHGGVLDRIDSLLFNIPLAYYYLSIYIAIGGILQ